jgi:hypothetical protein
LKSKPMTNFLSHAVLRLHDIHVPNLQQHYIDGNDLNHLFQSF